MEQTSGDSSQNIQAGRDVHITGLTYTDVRKICDDLFEANFYRLVQQAGQTVTIRKEEFQDQFLQCLADVNPLLLSRFSEPAIQYSLFNVQKEYARTGDKELAKLLQSILLERLQAKDRSYEEIVLDECISVLPRLSKSSLALLTTLYIARYVDFEIKNLDEFKEAIRNLLPPEIDDTLYSSQSIRHLFYCNCVRTTIDSRIPLVRYFYTNKLFPYFHKGISHDDLNTISIDSQLINQLFVPSIWNSELLQPVVKSSAGLQSFLKDKISDEKVRTEIRSNLWKIISKSMMRKDEQNSFFEAIDGRFRVVLNETDLGREIYRVQFTEVGKTIAKSYFNSWYRSSLKLTYLNSADSYT